MGKRKSKRRNVKPRVDESGNIVVMTSLEHTHAAMPKYNGWQCRGGVHGGAVRTPVCPAWLI